MEIIERIKQIHNDCHYLCNFAVGLYLPVAGNIGIFCQNDYEFNDFTSIRQKITKPSDNPNQKYFELLDPITVATNGEIPSAIYTHLYIRKPDPTPYGQYLGDVDFILDEQEYVKLKNTVINGETKLGMEFYNRPGWDTIQITNPSVSSVAYISTMEFAIKVRVKFD